MRQKQGAGVVLTLVAALAPVAAAIIGMTGITAQQARADLYWDTNGANPGATDGTAANGTWGVDNFWSTDASGSSNTQAWNQGDNAIFSAGSNAVTANVAVSGTQSFSGLQFLTGTTTLGGGSGNVLDYGSDGSVNPSVVVAPALTATVNTIINGMGQIQVSGGGTLKLGTDQTQPNTFGSFYGIVGDNIVSTGALSITGGSTVEFAGENDATSGAANPLGAAPDSAISNYITIDNGTLRNTNNDSSGTASFVLPNRGIIVNSGGATFDLPATGSVLNNVSVVDLSSGGLLTKTGPGTLQFSSGPSPNLTGGNGSAIDIEGGTISIFSSLNLGSEAYLRLNGGTLLQTNPGNAGSLISSATELRIGPNGGTIGYTSSGTATVSIYSGTITGEGGTTTNGGAQTLTVDGADEIRNQGAGTANNTFAKLVVKGGGLFRAGYAAPSEFETTFGATPLSFLPDAITLDNGYIGSSWGTVLNANRGITLAAGGGGVITSGGSMTLTETIAGPGAFVVTGVSSTSTAGAVLDTDPADAPNNWTGGTVLGNTNPTSLFTTPKYGNIVVKAGSVLGQGPVTFNNGTLTLSNAAQTVASLNSADGVGTVALGSNTVLTLNADSGTASFGGTITGGDESSLIKTGRGTQTLTGVNTYSGGTTIMAGTLATPAVSDLGIGNITINGGALVVTDPSQMSEVGGDLASSYYMGAWDQGMFRISTGTDGRSLGYALVNNQVKVMYTLPGDTNLDGTVDSADFSAIGSAGPIDWAHGDFNYDGKIDGDDWALYTLGAALGSLPASQVPEPAAPCLIILIGAGAQASRRRRMA